MRYVLAIMAVALGLVVSMSVDAFGQCGVSGQSIQQAPLVQRATAADLEALRRSVLSDRQQIAGLQQQRQLVPVQQRPQQQQLTQLSIEADALQDVGLEAQGGCPNGQCPLQNSGVQIRQNAPVRAAAPAQDRFTSRVTLSRSAVMSFVGHSNGQMPTGNVATR